MNSQISQLFIKVIAFLVLFNSCNKDEEFLKPEISSFTPTEGIAGETEVIIAGKNFSEVPGENIVKFGTAYSTVTAATSASLTVLVPTTAVTGRISVTVNEYTAYSQHNFNVLKGPSDFFTLTVDPSFISSADDNWILASSKNGDWIDAQPFEAGEVKVLNGIIPDPNTFNLHFMFIKLDTIGKYYISIKSFGEVEVNGTWLIKTPVPGDNTSYDLTVEISNIIPSNRPFPNNIVNVSSNVRFDGGYSSFSSGGNVNVNVGLREKLADIFVTVYQDDYPYYTEFNEVALPAVLSLDASADLTVADRTYVLNLPENDYFFVAIDAIQGDQLAGYRMADFIDLDGGSSVKMGYNSGYEKYRTTLSYRNGNTTYESLIVASTVDENPVIPSFTFNLTGTTVNDFACESNRPFTVSSTNFSYLLNDVLVQWNYIQPKPEESTIMCFKNNSFPSVILNEYPFLPDLNEIKVSRISAFDYLGNKTYEEMISAQSQSGSTTMNLFSYDSFYRFMYNPN